MQRLECNPIKVGGYRNHFYILCQLSKKISQVKLLEEIKKQSSKCLPAGKAGIKTKGKMDDNFYWQAARLPLAGIWNKMLYQTILKKQEEHHRMKTFQEELITFLDKYNVEYDEKYIWD